MTYTVTGCNVVIASPGDAGLFRDAVERQLHRWNQLYAERRGIVLMPRRWESTSVPLVTGTDGQTVLNAQLIDKSDVVIALFCTKLGTPTGRGLSGTAEEIQRAFDSGKPVHVYFSEVPVSMNDVDIDQYRDLKNYRESLKGKAYYDTFVTEAELSEKVQRAIEHDVDSLTGDAILPAAENVDLRAEFKSSSDGRTDRLHISNDGTATATAATVEVQAIGTGHAPSIWDGEVPLDIRPGAEQSYHVNAHGGTAHRWRVRMSWTDTTGTRQTQTQDITAI